MTCSIEQLFQSLLKIGPSLLRRLGSPLNFHSKRANGELDMNQLLLAAMKISNSRRLIEREDRGAWTHGKPERQAIWHEENGVGKENDYPGEEGAAAASS